MKEGIKELPKGYLKKEKVLKLNNKTLILIIIKRVIKVNQNLVIYFAGNFGNNKLYCYFDNIIC